MANQKSLENLAEHRIKRYLQLAEDMGATQTLDEIERYERLLSSPDCPEDVNRQFEQFCCEHVFYDTEGEERIPYNYYDLHMEKLDYSIAFHAKKGEVIKLMKDFVENSIKPLTEEERESGAG